MAETVTTIDAWRRNREPGWSKDPGYALQEVLGEHQYRYDLKGAKPADPGWHECSCHTWEGYWSGFQPHVADHLRAAVLSAEDAPLSSEVVRAAAFALAKLRLQRAGFDQVLVSSTDADEVEEDARLALEAAGRRTRIERGYPIV